MLSVEEVKFSLEQAGQSHVLQFWPELSEDEKKSFLSELSQLDFNELSEHCRGAAEAAARSTTKVDLKMEPVPSEFLGSVVKSDRDTINEWQNEGYLQISENKVAVLLLAGGQGTRLGVSYPKGMYDVGLPSKKTLYQIQAERICRMQQLANMKHGSKCTIPWYIMTSEFTLDPTKRFFEKNKHFGLDPANVLMFEQRMIPAVTFDGKVILQNKGKLAMAPDGNGGLYRALVDNQVLEDMQRRGVKYLHVYCVDNILVKMADPIFIGFCVSKQADCGAKVVQKASPEEPVGVVCRVDGVSQVVEYSELPKDAAELRLPGGELLYCAGNICNHFLTLSFLQEVALRFVAFEVAREDEFSPLKNAPGAPLDTPSSARQALLALHLRWVLAAGARFLGDTKPRVALEEEPAVVCEISPLVSYSGEGLDLMLRDKVLASPFLLDDKTAKQLLQ